MPPIPSQSFAASRRVRRRSVASLSVLLVLACAGGDGGTSSAERAELRLRSADWLSLLPDGVEKRQFILDCTNCHVVDRRFAFAADTPRSRAGWTAAVDRMLSYAGAHTAFPVMTVGRDAAATADWVVAHFTRIPEPARALPMPEGATVDEFLLPDSTDLPHDVAVLPDGRILVTGMASHLMWVLDPRTGRWSTEEIPLPAANPRAVDVRAEADPAARPDWWVLLGNPHRVARRSGETGEWRTYEIGFYGHSIVEGSLGRVWFNSHFTRSPGIIGYVDSSTDEVVRFEIPTPDTLAGGGTPIPYGLREAPDGSIWGTELRGNRLVRLDPASGAVRAYAMPFRESGPRRPDFDREGRLWIPEYAGNALTVFEPAAERFTRYELPVPDAAPYVVRIDHRRRLAWVGTATADAAFAFDLETKEFLAYPLPSVGALVRHIDIDERTGEVWLAYGAVPGIAARIARIRPAGWGS